MMPHLCIVVYCVPWSRIPMVQHCNQSHNAIYYCFTIDFALHDLCCFATFYVCLVPVCGLAAYYLFATR